MIEATFEVDSYNKNFIATGIDALLIKMQSILFNRYGYLPNNFAASADIRRFKNEFESSINEVINEINAVVSRQLPGVSLLNIDVQQAGSNVGSGELLLEITLSDEDNQLVNAKYEVTKNFRLITNQALFSTT